MNDCGIGIDTLLYKNEIVKFIDIDYDNKMIIILLSDGRNEFIDADDHIDDFLFNLFYNDMVYIV